MFTVHFLEISIAFVLKLFTEYKKIENRIKSLRIEIESGHLNRYPALKKKKKKKKKKKQQL